MTLYGRAFRRLLEVEGTLYLRAKPELLECGGGSVGRRVAGAMESEEGRATLT